MNDDGTVELADDGGIELETLRLELGVGIGNGERGASEFVPVETKDVVMLALELGVMLGGTVSEELNEGVTEALTVETARTEVNGTVMFALELEKRLDGMVAETFEDGTIELLLGRGVELVRGNGDRGSSELVPVDPRLLETLTLGVDGSTVRVIVLELTMIVEFSDGAGVLTLPIEVAEFSDGAGVLTLPIKVVEFSDGAGLLTVPTEVVELADGTAELVLPTGVDELVRGNGERGASELVPVDPRLDVMFAMGVDAGTVKLKELETNTRVELEGGTAELIVPTGVVALEDGPGVVALPNGVDELVRGKGLRGTSELVPVEPVETEATGPVELAEGVVIPLLPVAEEVYVLPEIVI